MGKKIINCVIHLVDSATFGAEVVADRAPIPPSAHLRVEDEDTDSA